LHPIGFVSISDFWSAKPMGVSLSLRSRFTRAFLGAKKNEKEAKSAGLLRLSTFHFLYDLVSGSQSSPCASPCNMKIERKVLLSLPSSFVKFSLKLSSLLLECSSFSRGMMSPLLPTLEKGERKAKDAVVLRAFSQSSAATPTIVWSRVNGRFRT
jgi:hypothetical protein